MAQGLAICVLFTFFCLPRGMFSTPFVQRSLSPVGNGADDTGPTSDAGAIDSCVLLQEYRVCGINYSVPASIARIASAIVWNIEGISNSPSLYDTEECMEAAREVACAQRFPRCDAPEGGDVQVHLSSDGCEGRLRESCGDATVDVLINDGYCSLQSSVWETATCKSTAQYAADALAGSRELQYCTQDQQVTPWMYELLLYYDALFGGIAEDLQRQYAGTCYQLQANFTCQLLGQCSEDGRRVDVINTREMCNTFIDCFPDSHADGLREQYNCDHWPEQVTIQPTSSPSSVDTQEETTTRRTWPTPTDNTLEVGGSSMATLSLIVLTASLLLTL